MNLNGLEKHQQHNNEERYFTMVSVHNNCGKEKNLPIQIQLKLKLQ
jgi:hypothetical protein